MADHERATLLTIPPEIREQIYRILLHPDANRLHKRDGFTDYNYGPNLVLFRLNRQIYHESRRVFGDLNVLVRIETPWLEAQEHVSVEGHVPILMKGARATAFAGHSLAVNIDAPETHARDGSAPPQYRHFVIHLDDLPQFTRTWFYSDLDQDLNGWMTLHLHLRDPRRLEGEGEEAPRQMPKALQQRLLLPFGEIKRLGRMRVTGDPAPLAAVEEELRALQAVPAPTAEECLAEAERLKEEGNAALKRGDHAGALAIYEDAWAAMHIVVRGRRRTVHADHFFARALTAAPYAGQSGQMARITLRVHLVANTCLAHLQRADWDEVVFWGMRTIGMMRDGTFATDRDIPPESEAVQGFPAAASMGKIYYRTARALMELGDKAQARRLLRVAAVYLPRDRQVQEALAKCALRIL